MVNFILKYMESPLRAFLPFLATVNVPVYRLSKGKIYKGIGSEKEDVSISDSDGNSLYIRTTAPTTYKETKSFDSCNKNYLITTRCRAVFYTFGTNDFEVSPDKVAMRIQSALNKIDFTHYKGSSTEIKISILSSNTDVEKIFSEETGKPFTGNVWPVFVTVDFLLSYEDTTCDQCDIDEHENPVTWTPDLTPENCETRAICDAVAACEVIKDLQEKTEDLQQQINDLPAPGLSCEELASCSTIEDLQTQIDNIPKITGTITVIENIAAFEVINSDGSKADSSIVNKRNKSIGIALQAINNGFSGDYQSSGAITNPAWNFIKGDILYLNGSVISNMAPSTGFCQIIGKAISTDSINININQAIRL